MQKILLYLIIILTSLSSCAHKQQMRQQAYDGFNIKGAWMLISLTDQNGNVFPMDFGNYTRCKIFDPDSTYYSIELKVVGNETIVIPHELARYSLRVTPDDTLYIENDRLMQFQIIDNSTFTTVWDGYVETMRRSVTMTESRKDEIRNIVRSQMNEKGEVLHDFILSTSERKLKSTVSIFHYVLTALLVIVVAIFIYAHHTARRRRELELRLSAIMEEKQYRPEPMSRVMSEMADGFFRSEYYLSLRQRIKVGENMTDTDWEEMERQLNAIFPAFTSKLRSLYNFSDTEFHVCLLLKLRATNKEIAAVIKRAPDSVSSIRNRLYKKVLGPNGGAKEWDEFVLAL